MAQVEGKPIHQDQPKERPIIRDVLADRYASSEMLELFSPEYKTLLERDLWITIMRAQSAAGLNIPEAAIEAYEAMKNHIDLDSIRRRERQLRHDEKAKLEEFNALAGYQYAHLGLTSRDQSDNVEQMQNKMGMGIVRDRAVATLARFAEHAVKNSDLVTAARTHNAVAQRTLMGKRFTDAGEDLLIGLDTLETFMDKYPLRGLKGAVGTQTDQLQLLGSKKKVAQVEKMVAEFLGFKKVLGSVGQVYPRSLDFALTSALVQVVAGPADLALTMRLMAGNEQFTEGFKPGQVGSTAMPHKMNTRSCERVHALTNVLKGYHDMTKGLIGMQWYEGDVSCSATRRVALTDAFFATDGIFQTMLTILDEGGMYPAVVERELRRYLPFLTTTKVLMAAVKNGVGRETAHQAIKENAIAVALDMREKGTVENNLFDRLAQDERLGLTTKQIEKAIANPVDEVGTAPEQIVEFVAKVEALVKKYPEAAACQPEPIL